MLKKEMLKEAIELRDNLVRYKDSKDELKRRRAHVELDRWLMMRRLQVIELVIEALQRRSGMRFRWKLWPTHKYECTACKKEFADTNPIYKVEGIVCCSYKCWLDAIGKEDTDEYKTEG